MRIVKTYNVKRHQQIPTMVPRRKGFQISILIVLAAKTCLCHDDTATEMVSFPSSCIGQPDGYQWLKMLEGDDYKPVHQLCSSDYVVINVDEDSNVESYFTSFVSWHYALSGRWLFAL